MQPEDAGAGLRHPSPFRSRAGTRRPHPHRLDGRPGHAGARVRARRHIRHYWQSFVQSMEFDIRDPHRRRGPAGHPRPGLRSASSARARFLARRTFASPHCGSSIRRSPNATHCVSSRRAERRVLRRYRPVSAARRLRAPAPTSSSTRRCWKRASTGWWRAPATAPGSGGTLLASHTLAADAGRIAAEAGVRHLVLNHLIPADDRGDRRSRLGERRAKKLAGSLDDRPRRACCAARAAIAAQGGTLVKLATLKNGTRDGRLALVSRDLTRYTDAVAFWRRRCRRRSTTGSAFRRISRLWPSRSSMARCRRRASTSMTRTRRCRAPISGRTARPTSTMSSWCGKRAAPRCRPSFWTDPLIYQGGSDAFLDSARRRSCWPTRPGASTWKARSRSSSATCRWARRRDEALAAIRLLMLVNDVIAARADRGELAKGFGFFQSKPSSAFSPVAVTPDELGEAWDGGKLHLPLHVDLNARPFGRANAGVDMTFDFAQLIAHAARTTAACPPAPSSVRDRVEQARRRARQAGRAKAAPAIPASPRCAWSRRSLTARPKTPFLRFGDTVRIEMRDESGHSIFGAIEQRVERHDPSIHA